MAAHSSPFDRLWHKYQRTGDARVKGELTERLRPIVVSMAERVRAEMGSQPVIQDLVNAGMLGVLEAFERFDPSQGVYFETYCSWRVVGAMHDDQRKFDWASGAIRLKARRLRAAYDELSARLGRPPSDDELAEALDITGGDLAEIRRHAERPAPLNVDGAGPNSASESDEPWPVDPALVDESFDPERLALAREARALLFDEIEHLPDKQRYVMLLYYFERLKMADVGRVLGISEPRVSQLHKEGLRTLLRRLGPRRDDFLGALGV